MFWCGWLKNPAAHWSLIRESLIGASCAPRTGVREHSKSVESRRCPWFTLNVSGVTKGEVQVSRANISSTASSLLQCCHCQRFNLRSRVYMIFCYVPIDVIQRYVVHSSVRAEKGSCCYAANRFRSFVLRNWATTFFLILVDEVRGLYNTCLICLPFDFK